MSQTVTSNFTPRLIFDNDTSFEVIRLQTLRDVKSVN